MSNRHLVLPEVERMFEESRAKRRYVPGYEEGFQVALEEVKKLLLGIGVKVQITEYPSKEEK